MRAILIDPSAKDVREVEFSGSLKGPKGAYELLTSAEKSVDCIDLRNIGGDVLLVFDDEGGLVSGNPTFEIGTLVIAGRALLALSDDDTESGFADAPSFVTVDDVKSKVTFSDLVTSGDFEPGRDMTAAEIKAHGYPEDFSGWKGGDMIRQPKSKPE